MTQMGTVQVKKMADPTGAARQRDGTFAIVTRMPAGIVSPEDLETIARVAREYRVPLVKLTGGQRILLAGLAPGDVQKAIDDLGPLAQPENTPCVKYVLACPGTTMCRYGTQDAIALARSIGGRFAGQTFPAKVKIGVSGCERCCSTSSIRDIGLIGTNRGWTILFGGNGGRTPRFADTVAHDLSDSEALDCVQRLAEYYKTRAKPRERTGPFMERIGMEALQRELLDMLPYIPVGEAR